MIPHKPIGVYIVRSAGLFDRVKLENRNSNEAVEEDFFNAQDPNRKDSDRIYKDEQMFPNHTVVAKRSEYVYGTGHVYFAQNDMCSESTDAISMDRSAQKIKMRRDTPRTLPLMGETVKRHYAHRGKSEHGS